MLTKAVDHCANWFEAFGFILGIVTTFKVFIIDKKIFDFNKEHLFQTRSEEQIIRLKKISGDLVEKISNFDTNVFQIKMFIKTAEEISKSIIKKLPKNDRKKFKKFIKQAQIIENMPIASIKLSFWKRKLLSSKTEKFSEQKVKDFTVMLTGLITLLKELKKDKEKSLLL